MSRKTRQIIALATGLIVLGVIFINVTELQGTENATIAQVEEVKTPKTILGVDLEEHIEYECGKRGLDPFLVYSVIEVESDFNKDCISDMGESVGLMQVQEKWHKDRMKKLGVTNLLDPYENTLVGIDLLDELIDKYGIEGGLSVYNTGRPDGNPKYKTKVLKIYKKWKE